MSDKLTGTSAQVSLTGSNLFCLEVDTAHRYTVGHTIQLNNNALIVLPGSFRPSRTGGRCPPLNKR